MADNLRVLISSTAIDLEDHRKAVLDGILRLEHLPIAMEHFGAIARPPLEVCREKVLTSDVVVVTVAHRYGWVPSEEQGGDGEKSITWYEVDFALAEGIPVLAYLVDPAHPWLHPKEQDLLVDADSQKEAARIYKNVRALKKLQAFLKSDANLTCDFFTSPDDLAKRVVASLAQVRRRADQFLALEARIEMLEAAVKLLTSAAESTQTSPEDKKELKIVKSEVESVIVEARENPQSLSSSPLDIALVVGHSPRKPGALGQINRRSYSEFAYNAELAPILVRKLTAHGLKTEMFVRDISGDIRSGISAAAARTPTLIVELHANAFNGKVRGCSAMIRADAKGIVALAEDILTAIQESTGIPVRGVSKVGPNERGSTALYATANKSILLHPFFIDNEEDLLVATQEINELADAIATAIAESFRT